MGWRKGRHGSQAADVEAVGRTSATSLLKTNKIKNLSLCSMLNLQKQIKDHVMMNV